MPDFLKYIFLGFLQGATEFLPVSSSGHLTIFSRFLNVPLNEESKAAFFTVLHLATFFAVLVFTYRDIWLILSKLADRKDRKNSLRYILLLLVATIPAVVFGFFFEEKIEVLFSDAWLASVMLFVTALVLLISDSFKGKRRVLQISIAGALSIGLFQAIAIVPGISRSGMTIFGALLIGLTRSEAVRFSFLLSLPVTLGAGILKLSNVDLPLTTLLPAATIAFVTGLFGLWLGKLLVLKGRLRFFGIYCIIIGTVGLIILGVI